MSIDGESGLKVESRFTLRINNSGRLHFYYAISFFIDCQKCLFSTFTIFACVCGFHVSGS